MKRDWDAAFPRTPESFHRTMNESLEAKNLKRYARKRKATTALIAALIAALALGGAALAVSKSGVLNMLFRGTEPPKEAQDLLRQAKASVEREGVRLSIDEYIHDGNTLTVAWSVESTRDEPVLYDGNGHGIFAMVGDESLEFGSAAGNLDYLVVLGGSVDGVALPQRRESVCSYVIPSELQDREIQLVIKNAGVYKVFGELASAEQECVFDEEGEERWYARSDALIVDEEGATEPYCYPEVEKLVEKGLKAAPEVEIDEDEMNPLLIPEEPYTELDALVEMGLIAPLVKLDLETTAQPTPNALGRHTAFEGERVHAFDGYTLTVDKVDFSAASSSVVFTLRETPETPKKTGKIDPLSQSYALLNEDGLELLMNITLNGNMSGGWWSDNGEQENGGRMKTYIFRSDPFPIPPNEITIVPIAYGKDSSFYDTAQLRSVFQSDCLLWDQAVRIKVIRLNKD